MEVRKWYSRGAGDQEKQGKKSATFFCVKLPLLLISWWLLLLYTQNDEDGRWAKPQNDSSRIGKLVRD